jgi:flagellar hook protein FlgE
MLDSIHIGTSGLTSFSDGLRTVSNNLTNINTPGYKGAQAQFAAMFSQQSDSSSHSSGGNGSLGSGLESLAASINFKQGDFQQTGNQLDAAIDGLGFFVLKDTSGQINYTRDGQFQFDKNSFLVSRTNGARVQALSNKGELQDISLSGLGSNSPKATATATFNGNLSTDVATFTAGGVNVFDSVGGQHTLSLLFTNNNATTPGQWSVTVQDGTTTVGTGTIVFSNGLPVAGKNTVSLTYSPSGVPPIPLTFDFSTNVTSFSAGTTSTLALQKQDGYGAGSLTNTALDAEGYVVATYSNGQTVKGARLALAKFDSDLNLVEVGGNNFVNGNSSSVHYGYASANSFGKLTPGSVEGSNVDMAQEFSNLIVMQRGYQAASHVISTANDMIQDLFDMKGNR